MFKIYGAKNDVWKGSFKLLPQKCKFLKNVGKTIVVTLKVHEINKERFRMFRLITCFSWHNVHRQRGYLCLKLISIAVNHCVTLLRYDVTWRCVNVGKPEL